MTERKAKERQERRAKEVLDDKLDAIDDAVLSEPP
jgi:hypothetical protein